MTIKNEKQLKPYSWGKILIFGAAAGPIFGLGLLYPLLPKTITGWIVCIACCVIVGLVMAISALLIGWLQSQNHHIVFFRSIGFLLGISVGIGIFWTILSGKSFLIVNFKYYL